MECTEVLIQESPNLEIWIPAIISIVTLIVNMMFYLFAQPHISYKAKAKEELTKISVELLNYLAEIISYEKFDGVPTKVRKYSLQIHLHFKEGSADGKIEILLEKIFKETQKRKNLTDNTEIEKWNDDFRTLVRDLRKNLARYCGTF